jgi:ABC-type ATPase with predicted acetyltransferase domain
MVSTSKEPIQLVRGEDLQEKLHYLALAGLAEADLFVRPSNTLSLGQRYRLALAVALSRQPDLLLVDEFCEPLDRFSTTAVCRRLRKSVALGSFGTVVATAFPSKVVGVLKPNRTLLLSSDGAASWLAGTEGNHDATTEEGHRHAKR